MTATTITTILPTIDHDHLASVCGGEDPAPATAPAQRPPPRSWTQVAADYTASCAANATTAAIFQGRPASWQQMALTGAIGCAAGIATQAANDWRTHAAAKHG